MLVLDYDNRIRKNDCTLACMLVVVKVVNRHEGNGGTFYISSFGISY
jgi:hypothetical protein